MYHLTEAYLLAALICVTAAYLGALLFGAGGVAPLMVRTLGEEVAGPLLRAYWPRFHGFAVAVGTVIMLSVAVGSVFSAVPSLYALLVVTLCALMTVCFLIGWRLIPAINAARDAGAMAEFARLHRLDVLLVGVGMILALAVIAALVYVLPGQFTFWPAAGGAV
jgi:hypothetical protein